MAQKFIFPEGITEIADEAFSEDRTIEHVEIPESVEVIGEGAFSFCRHLKTVRICGPLKKIKAEAFLNCRRLISINIPDTVTRIGSEAFCGCDSLGFIVIPDSVKTIGEDAFSECETLKKIYIRNPEILEDTGYDDDVQIITNFDEKEIPDITLRPARKYVFQYAVNATAGQLVKDLKDIVSQNPECFVTSTMPNGNEFYIKDFRLWNEILLLNVCWDEDEALSAKKLLDELSGYDEATKVLLGSGWELLNFEVEEGGSILRYDEDYGYAWFDFGHDVRLFDAGDLNRLLDDLAERFPDRKIMCKISDGDYCPVTDVDEDDDRVYINIKAKDGECITVSEFSENLEGEEVEVLFFDGLSKEAVRKTILADKGPVFFEDKVDGEDVIAFRLGETLYDPRVEDDEDDDFWNDNDTVISLYSTSGLRLNNLL